MSHQVPPVTVDAVQRFYAVFCRLGLDRIFDQAAATPDAPTGRPVTITEQQATPTDAAQVEVVVDVSVVFREFLRGGCLQELAGIIFGLSDEDARGVTVDELEDAFGPFVTKSMQPIYMVLTSGAGWASATPVEA